LRAFPTDTRPPVSEYLSRVRRELRIYQSGF